MYSKVLFLDAAIASLQEGLSVRWSIHPLVHRYLRGARDLWQLALLIKIANCNAELDV